MRTVSADRSCKVQCVILSHRRESMQRAAGKRFVCFPDSSNDQRGKRTNTGKQSTFSALSPLESPKKDLQQLCALFKQQEGMAHFF